MTRIVQSPRPLATRCLPRCVLTGLVTGTLLLGVTAAQARPTPAQKCAAAKHTSVGRYAACRQNAQAKLATTGNSVKYGAALTKCGARFTKAWQRAIARAAKVNATCLDAPLTEGDFQTILDQTTTNIATALTGLGLTDCTADLATCADTLSTCPSDLATCTTDVEQATSDLTTCHGTVTTLSNGLSTCEEALGTAQTDLATCQAAPQGRRLKTGQTTCYNAAGTLIACAGTGQDGERQHGLPRAYTDHGDGTITDTRTGLMWEKLSDDGSLHDKDTTYTWTNAFAVKVAGLNSGGGFAGHTDWRVPNVNELQSLVQYIAAIPAVDAAFNTACSRGCTVTRCSCTQSQSFNYWSATTYRNFASFAWSVNFDDGNVNTFSKSSAFYVRGVRGST